MIIEIKGINFNNIGAELMFIAIIEKIHEYSSKIPIVVDVSFKTFNLIKNKYNYENIGFTNHSYHKIFYHLLPKRLLRKMKFVHENEIGVLLDSSGFAYSDQWGSDSAKLMSKITQVFKNRQKQIIFLPQAFGPFNNIKNKHYFFIILNNADLIFVRDNKSLDYINRIKKDNLNIKLAPDFTNLVKGNVPEETCLNEKTICLIPNYRMIDKIHDKSDKEYLFFWITVIKEIKKNKLSFFILCHEYEKDEIFIEKINKELSEKVKVVYERNPKNVKGILGKSYIVISSRYHGLISALSQNIPCIGTSWSHKYQTLFQDYYCSELLIKNLSDKEEIRDKLSLLINNKERNKVIKKLYNVNEVLLKKTKEMWSEVFNLIENNNNEKHN